MRNSTLVLALFAAFVLALATSSQATVLYTTDFPEASGSLPTDWAVLAGTTGAPGWRIDGGGDFRYDGSGNGISHYTGPLAAHGSSTALTDFTVETHFRKTDGALGGLVGRVQDSGSFYHARLRGQTALEVYRFDSGASLLGSVTASDTYNQGETWRIEMVFSGTSITANLFNQVDTQVGTLAVSDSTFASGSAGLRGSNPNAFEDFTISGVIPEPTTLLIWSLLAGLGVGLGWRRRK